MPAGFVLVFFGLLSLVYSVLSGYAGWCLWKGEQSDSAVVVPDWRWLFLQSGGALLLALVLMFLGIRWAFRTRPFDPHDPDQPMMKF